MESYPNLRHIRLFAHAVAASSLSKAAEAVRVSQPAASQAISKLEGQFGGPLFERRGGGVLPTRRGLVVAARAVRALELLRDANAKLVRQSRMGRGLAQDLLETHATIAHLRAMAAFAQTGSFSAAARLIEQAEHSVQRAARELERIGGVALFDGRQQAARLTPAGLMLASRASLVLKELESAAEDVGALDGRFDGRIVVGTLPLVRTRIIPDAVSAWTRRHPAASIEILDGSYDVLIHSLGIGGIDMLVGALRDPAPKGLRQEALFDDGLSIVARAGHPLMRASAVTGRELSNYPWALPRKGTPTRAIFDAIAKGFGIEAGLSGIVETGSLVALRGILLDSDRLTILSRRQIAYEESAGLLGVVPIELPPTRRPIGITTRSGWQPTLLQRAFVDMLRAVAT